MSEFKQAPRTERDGTVGVNRDGDNSVIIAAFDSGTSYSIRVSWYNAARLFALLGFMLGINLPRQAAKAIKL